MFFIVLPVYGQFTDLPSDQKTVDIGVTGDKTNRTVTLTAVVPVTKFNGWAGFFGSRSSSEEGVHSEIVKLHIESLIDVKLLELEAFSYFERNMLDGSALTAQVGGTIQPGEYKNGSLSISANFGYFLETIRPFEEFKVRQFDPTAFRWLVTSTLDWNKVNTELTFTPEIGFKNYRICAEPTVTFDLTNNFGIRVSGTVTYNSEPLTDNLQYVYLSTLRITL
ncbi:hypothetical protein JT359_06645 [Candidatus Poribacteria bacterium]|nr:hypothetical protein [Candidatus Poribacteria bacterium]